MDKIPNIGTLSVQLLMQFHSMASMISQMSWEVTRAAVCVTWLIYIVSILQSKEGKTISIYIAESVGAYALALNHADGCSAPLFPVMQGFSKKVGTWQSNSIHPNLCLSIALV